MEDLATLKQPVAIRTEYIASHPTLLHIKQHKASKKGAPREDLTVWRLLDATNSSSQDEREKLFSVNSESIPFSQRRHVHDASGLPLFELSQKKAGVTWFVYLPGGEETSRPMAVIAPRWNPLKNKLDVYVSSDDGSEVKLKVRGQDVSKSRTHVYFEGALVMTATRMDKHVSLTELEWQVEVASGLDISLASVIIIVLAYMLHSTAASSYSGAGSSQSKSRVYGK
ncbi:tubby C-terminal-like domain-containing protein [Aspergillus pseudoustus]|uniref:Tubby C-terminal-like domain-containing protein n=1 Tax=Aspergillus pseudoustus TaxID=1810923 RepID=A0ABR4JMZ6_9EURO